MTLVAPIERFNALAILVTPFLSLAIVFNVRTSSFDHARRITFFFLANFDSLFFGTGLVARQSHLAIQRPINFCKGFFYVWRSHLRYGRRLLRISSSRPFRATYTIRVSCANETLARTKALFRAAPKGAVLWSEFQRTSGSQ
jgi:hypothetical protein